MNGDNSGFNASVGFSFSHATITPANASTLRKVWTATSGGPVFAQPIVANETVYWESFDGYERATSTSGALVWKTFLGTTTPQAGTLHSAVGWQETEVFGCLTGSLTQPSRVGVS